MLMPWSICDSHLQFIYIYIYIYVGKQQLNCLAQIRWKVCRNVCVSTSSCSSSVVVVSLYWHLPMPADRSCMATLHCLHFAVHPCNILESANYLFLPLPYRKSQLNKVELLLHVACMCVWYIHWTDIQSFIHIVYIYIQSYPISLPFSISLCH